MAGSEITALLELIDQAYNRKAWHGPNLRGSIRRVDAATAAWRPGEDRRNIWEIVVHSAYWKYAVRRRLVGEKRGSFPLKGSNWFRRPATLAEDSWEADVALLEQTHQALRAAVAELRPTDLDLRPSG